MGGGSSRSSFNSMPPDIILHILSLASLPLHSLLRLRFLCKSLYVAVTELAEADLKRSRENSLGITYSRSIGIHIYSLQEGGGFKSLMGPEYVGADNIELLPPINGLICFTALVDFHVCNPITGEFVTLPRCLQCAQRFITGTGFGYCPQTKQYKVIESFEKFPMRNLASKFKAAIKTIGSSDQWRIVDCPMPIPRWGTIYMDGTIYWLNVLNTITINITAFDVDSETFRRINPLPPDLYKFDDSRRLGGYDSMRLGEYEGRLCLVDYQPHYENFFLRIYIMLREHQWVFGYKVLLKDLQPYYAVDPYSINFSCLNKGKLILRIIGERKRVLFYNIKSRDFEALEVGDQGLNTTDFKVALSNFEGSLTLMPREPARARSPDKQGWLSIFWKYILGNN
ncbi:putative F-box protein At5g15660 [Castanea sativa]|uniref:putative F-box protein At5g15660 n=1 Tax=Castanea sativa TaxID=21020 RepID=UPI003F6494CB